MHFSNGEHFWHLLFAWDVYYFCKYSRVNDFTLIISSLLAGSTINLFTLYINVENVVYINMFSNQFLFELATVDFSRRL